jgi:hypothetical protein
MVGTDGLRLEPGLCERGEACGMSAEIIQLPAISENRSNIEKRFRAVLDAQGDDICGFALVVWGSNTRSTADLGAKIHAGSVIPEILIPDFVRNRLLAVKIEEWTVDTVRGYVAPDDDPA